MERCSILLFDSDGTMRFKAYRGLSETYRQAVEGHTPWAPDTADPEPIVVPDIRQDPALAGYRAAFEAEAIAAIAFIPLISQARVVGKFMLYHDLPHVLSAEDLQLAGVIAAHVAFAVERTRAEQRARRNEARLRFALDAASMGTRDWDLRTSSPSSSTASARRTAAPPASTVASASGSRLPGTWSRSTGVTFARRARASDMAPP